MGLDEKRINWIGIELQGVQKIPSKQIFINFLCCSGGFEFNLQPCSVDLNDFRAQLKQYKLVDWQVKEDIFIKTV